jgi:hypothetical protein
MCAHRVLRRCRFIEAEGPTVERTVGRVREKLVPFGRRYLVGPIRDGNLIHFSLLAVYFGLALYAATSSVVILAAEAELPWFWWGTLLPLAVTHAASGFLAIWHSTRGHLAPMICGAISATTTILTIVVAVWAAYGIGIWMPRHVAVMILVGASLAGLIGLAFASRLSHNRLHN